MEKSQAQHEDTRNRWGIGPESTIDYYRSLIHAWREQTKDGSSPAIVLNSIDLKKMLDLIAGNELSEVIEYLADEVQILARVGADVGLLAANTLHIHSRYLHE